MYIIQPPLTKGRTKEYLFQEGHSIHLKKPVCASFLVLELLSGNIPHPPLSPHRHLPPLFFSDPLIYLLLRMRGGNFYFSPSTVGQEKGNLIFH
jgi:hypothetical protein